MLAFACLLLLARALPAAPAAAPAPPAPAMLVLRAACYARLPQPYFNRSLDQYSATTNLNITHVLSYEETCGYGWREAVWRRAAAALGAGGTVVAAGALGAARCAGLAAAGGTLRGGGCARAEARAAATAAGAVAAGWQRAVLVHSGCGGAAALLARALAARGLDVIWYIEDYLSLRPDVVVMADCGRGGAREAEAAARARHGLRGAVWGARGAARLAALSRAPLLLALVPSDEALADDNHVDIFNFINTIDLEIDNSSYSKILHVTPPYPASTDSILYEEEEAQSTGKLHSLTADKTNSLHGHDTSNNGTVNGTWLFDEDIMNLLMVFEAVIPQSVLVLADHDAGGAGRRHAVRDALQGALRGGAERVQLVAARDGGGWRVADVRVHGAVVRCADGWAATARWGDAMRARAAAASELQARWMLAGSVVCGAGLVLLACAGLRRMRGRGGGRPPRGSPVLLPEHFQFPAEEGARRVGEGMESMLACWLQQLHEFGGPPPAPPAPPEPHAPPAPRLDLLKRPSQPSSACSVSRLPLDHRTRYKGEPVFLKALPAGAGGGAGAGGAGGAAGAGGVELRRRAADLLLAMQLVHHENINPFIGCLPRVRPALVFALGGRGSLEDVLVADDIRLDWTFRLSLLTDLVRGMRALHASPLRVHGRLSSRNCVVDSRWVLRVTDHGVGAFLRAQGLRDEPRPARALLWTAPELLRAPLAAPVPPADVYSFAIIMQEVILRGEPYCMMPHLKPEEIVEKLKSPPPLVRPSVSMSAAPPEAVGVMRRCWAEAPDLRPSFDQIYEMFRHLHRGRKINIVDSMFEMLEKYSDNLEELIRDRTEQLDVEKKKTEQLLNRMLPRSVAERLLLGEAVPPEEFADVSVYFSDIVGFTALAARSSPVQVVALLNELYTCFDAAIEQYRVYKVETIGDAYMVVGGAPTRCADHAARVASMALQLLHEAGTFRIRHLPGLPLHLRIGLHSGPVCAGVVGRTMPRYCLFGDTVNTASRMESTGAAWRIQVSAATAARLQVAGGYRLRARGLVQVKGKGAMHTYWLLGRDGFDKPLPTPPPLESGEVLLEVEQEGEATASAGEAAGEAAGGTIADSAPRADRLAGWQRGGTVSADCSPPPRALPPVAPAAPGVGTPDHSAPYSRYRCGGGARVLRRQWSLERGEALAVARALPPAPAAAAPPAEPPLALLQAPPPRAPPPRYRTRSEAP